MELFPARSIALSIGPLEVHWYGVMYAFAFLIGIYLLPFLERVTRLSLLDRQRERLFLAIFAGVLFGGRLGYVLLYGFSYFTEHPWKIFAVWEGGMSSHGGFLGVIIALFIFTRSQRINLLRLADTILIPVAIGLMLGRIGNLINGELYGTVANVPWALEFPGAEGLRHPTQVYAALKDLFLAVFLSITLPIFYRLNGEKVGLATGVFLLFYSVLRCIVEIFREQPQGLITFSGLAFSKGQLFTIPLFLLGLALVFTRGIKRS